MTDSLPEDKRLKLLEEAFAAMLNVDNEMGIYPTAVSGYGDERDYTQRDGFKNGWNAAVITYGAALTHYACKVGAPLPYDDDPPLTKCPLCEKPV